MRAFLLFLIILFAAGTAGAQEIFNFRLNGNGARSAGLGYAFTGVADDASAISWNPAGLVQLYQMEASVVGRMSAASGTVDGLQDIGITGWDVQAQSQFQFNFASFVVPFKIGGFEVVGGVAFRRMFDFSQEITQTITSDGFVFSFLEKVIYNDTAGGINAISPSLGFKINDMLSLGVTANILTGSEEGNSSVENDGILDSESSYAIDYSGLIIDLGVLARLSEMISVGATISLPHERKYSFSDVSGVDFTLADGTILSQEGTLSAPLFYRVGVGVRPTDKLLLAFDYNSRPISKVKLESGNTLAELNMPDISSFHIGLEYLLGTETIIPIRLGYYTNPLGTKDVDDKEVVAGVITAGTGIALGNVILDASIELSGYQQTLDNTGPNDITFTEGDVFITLGAVIHLGE